MSANNRVADSDVTPKRCFAIFHLPVLGTVKFDSDALNY